MDRCFLGDRVTDGDRRGIVVGVLFCPDRGMTQAAGCEVQVRWDDGGEPTFECLEDLRPEAPDPD